MYWISILQVLDCNCTETTTMSLKHSLIDLHQERPTQCNPGHVSIHFIPQSQSHPPTQFFEKISIGACFSTAVEWARILQTVSNSAKSLYHKRCTRHNQVLRNKPFIFGLLERQTWPLSTFLCFCMSCHSSRMVQDHPGGLKLGPIALPLALYTKIPRVMKLEACLQSCGAPKMTPLTNFPCAIRLL